MKNFDETTKGDFMNTKLDSTIVGGLLEPTFVSNSVPKDSKIDSEIERLKDKAGCLALTLFDPGKKDVSFGASKTFGNIFSEDIYGARFAKGLSIILAYLICLEEGVEGRSEALRTFAGEVHSIGQNTFKRLSSGDHKLSDVRKSAEQLDNYGGYYQRTLLSQSIVQTIVSKGILNCRLEIDDFSGHLVARIPMDLSQQLLDAYRLEIQGYLTEEGRNHLNLPYNLGIVVVAYKDEFDSIPTGMIKSLLGTQIGLSFKEPYIVPVRGDNRYSLVASILIESSDISRIRNEMKLTQLYSEGRPLRYTFGAVRTPHLECNNDELIQKMRKCAALEPWMQFIDKQVTKKN
jgi:hypothetical protein